VKQERWFNTEQERKAAMRGVKLHENYAFRTEELELAGKAARPIAKGAAA
jgi:hypothetical protein